MTSSPIFQQLCCELIEDYYGDFYRTIFECVAGSRLSAQHVAQKCHLPLRQARAGLAGLVQSRLVHHHTTRDGPTVYSANLNNAYDIIRTGQLIEEAHRAHGELGADIITAACDLGFCTIGELRDRVLLLRGEDNETQHSRRIETTIDHLLNHHFLTNLRKAHFAEEHDVRREVELKILSPAAIAKLTGTKAKAEHQAAIDRAYFEAINTATSDHGRVNNSFMSKDSTSQASNAASTTMNGHSSRISTLVQPNIYKVVELAQAMVVADHVHQIYGKQAATIAGRAVRNAAYSDIWDKPDSLLDIPVKPLNVYKLLDDVNSAQRQQEPSPTTMTNGASSNGTIRHETNTQPELELDDLEYELRLLAETTCGEWLRVTEESSFLIHKGALDIWIRKEETLRLLDSRVDDPGPRILRILIDKGKLEERTLQELGLLDAKRLRQSLAALKQMGYIELQEVPRNPTRQPNMTVFLWAYEQGRVGSLTLEHMYTAILRLLQLLKLERSKIGSTLMKIDREDVKGREEEALGSAEYTVLNRFRRIESWIWAEIQRLDGSVAILRDT